MSLKVLHQTCLLGSPPLNHVLNFGYAVIHMDHHVNYPFSIQKENYFSYPQISFRPYISNLSCWLSLQLPNWRLRYQSFSFHVILYYRFECALHIFLWNRLLCFSVRPSIHILDCNSSQCVLFPFVSAENPVWLHRI